MEDIITKTNELKINNFQEIVYLKSSGSFTKKYNSKGKEFLVENALTQLEETLPNNKFFKINESLIINVDYLKKINVNTNRKALLHNGIELKISKQKYNDLIKFLKMRYSIW